MSLEYYVSLLGAYGSTIPSSQAMMFPAGLISTVSSPAWLGTDRFNT
jgi:hypothetical protein